MLRIIWQLMNRALHLEAGIPLKHLAAQASHLVLYVIMIILPLTGYLGTGGGTQISSFSLK